jgi:hypothetical protein
MSTTVQIPLPAALGGDPGRAELVFSGVEQAGRSFEARVFLDNPDADDRTPRTPEAGYVGSFHVYGHGSPEPPAIAEARAAGDGEQPVAPIEKRVHVGEPAMLAAMAGRDELAITVVTLPVEPGGVQPARAFERVAAVFDPGAAR